MRDLEFDIRARDRTASGFDSARSNARGFNRDIDQTARGFNIAATAAKAFAAAFTLTAVAEFGRVVRQTITDAADLVDMADKVGVSTENVQRMVYGFGLAGVAASDIEQILTQWSKRIGEAYTAGGRLADILKANGVSLTDSEGRLRSSVDLMRDYANLIANAGSDQERMTLATIGFGKAGDAMVLALRDGAEGMDRLMRAADDAGGVLDDALLRRAADIDDEFNAMWRNFEINAKSAILSAVGWLDDLRSEFRRLNDQYEANLRAAELGEMVGRMAGQPRPDKGGRLESPFDKRIDEAFRVSQLEKENAELARQLRDRYAARTIIPGKDDDTARRTASASAARDQESAYQRVIERLEQERDAIGLNETEQRILNEQRRAGVTATSEQGKAIAEVVRQIEAEREAIARRRQEEREFYDSIDYIFGQVEGSVLAIASGSEKASIALAKLALSLALAAAQAWLFGNGPLAGLGIFGEGIIKGARANGGPVDPWGTYLVGEKGPELLRMGGSGGTVVSNDEAFGRRGAERTEKARAINISFNVTAPDPQAFMKSRGQIESMIGRAVMRGQRNF